MRRLAYAGGALAFVLLATLNAGGYRYGASDQAFYIPAILKQLDPSLYPRDTALIGPQARYFFIDEIVAGVVRGTGWSMEACFAAGYVLSLVIMYAALWRLGHLLFRSSLATWALIAAETLRHRITKTGVNTLEGYFHPRILVFAVGVWSITAYLRGRPWLALGAVLFAGLLHPTTAGFFVLFLIVAIWTTEPYARRAMGALVTLGLIGVSWLLLAGPMRGSLWPMDEEWRALLASKDYLFPVRDWAVGAWLEPGHRGAGDRRALASSAERAGKAARGGSARRRGRAPRGLFRDAAGGDDGIRVLRAAARSRACSGCSTSWRPSRSSHCSWTSLLAR